MKYAGSIETYGNEIESLVIDKRDSFPTSPYEGQIFWHTVNKRLYLYNNSEWVQVGLIESISTTSATFDNLLITNSISVNDSITVSNLTVGSTVVFPFDVKIKDNLIRLNHGESSNGVSQSGTTAGLEIDRGTVPYVYLIWNESVSYWQLTNDGSNYYRIIDENYADNNYLKLDGSNSPSSSLDLGNMRIMNLQDPVNNQDAATKSYVDSRISGSWTEYTYNQTSGSTSINVRFHYNDPEVVMKIEVSSLPNDSEVMFSSLLPVTYRPLYNIKIPAVCDTTGSSNSRYSYIQILTTGDIKVYQNNGDSLDANLSTMVTYITS